MEQRIERTDRISQGQHMMHPSTYACFVISFIQVYALQKKRKREEKKGKRIKIIEDECRQ